MLAISTLSYHADDVAAYRILRTRWVLQCFKRQQQVGRGVI